MADEAAWYPDPSGQAELRWWDGEQWTEHTHGPAPGTELPAQSPGTDAGSDGSLPVLHARGHTGIVTVDGAFITIKRKGAMAKLNYGWTRGEKRIALATVTSVQFKRPGATAGYIQFSIAGGHESSKGVVSAMKDENSVGFLKGSLAEFDAVRQRVEAVIEKRHRRPEPAASGRDVTSQLRDLADLRDRGVLTDEEFATEKARILRGSS